MRLLTRGGYLAEIGKENIFPMRSRAVGFIYPTLDNEICRTCPAQIFSECKTALPSGERREMPRSAVGAT
jgi:SulP family sulfate permease